MKKYTKTKKNIANIMLKYPITILNYKSYGSND